MWVLKPDATDIVSQHPVQLPGELRIKAMNRAVVKGKNVSVYNYPEAVTRDLETVVGKYAYGFDLSGKPSANKFEDPGHSSEDRQSTVARGRLHRFLPGHPADDALSRRPALGHADRHISRLVHVDRRRGSHEGRRCRRDARSFDDASGPRCQRQYSERRDLHRGSRVSLAQRAQGRVEGRHDHDPPPGANLSQSEMPFYAEINLRDAQMRLTLQDDGAVVGYLGGYLKWLDFAYMHTARTANGADSIGIYHAVKKMADRYPDKSGKNQYISGTFRLVATPAYLATQMASSSRGQRCPRRAPAMRQLPLLLPYLRRQTAHRATCRSSTPPGLTVIDVPNDAHMFGFRRIGDAEGNFLFALKPDASGNVTCAGECAKDFAPLAAPPEAAAYDVWTLVDGGGAKQWAYQGRPLDRYTGSRPIGRIVASSEDDPAVYWKVVTFRPDLSVRAPSGLKVQSLEVAAGYGLVDAETGAVT